MGMWDGGVVIRELGSLCWIGLVFITILVYRIMISMIKHMLAHRNRLNVECKINVLNHFWNVLLYQNIVLFTYLDMYDTKKVVIS